MDDIGSYIFNKRVQKASLHFKKLKEDDKKYLIEYRGDTEEKDWRNYMIEILNKRRKITPDIPITRTRLHYKALKLLYYFDPEHYDPESIIQNYPIAFRQKKENWLSQLEAAVDLTFMLCDYPKDDGDDVFVYRGQRNYDRYKDLNSEDIIEEPGFLSTTLNEITAMNFSEGTTLMRIAVEPKTQLPFISPDLDARSNYDGGNESEVLFPPYTQFQFLNRTSKDGINFINFRVVKLPDIPKLKKDRLKYKKDYIADFRERIDKLDELYKDISPSSTASNSEASTPSNSVPPSPAHHYGGGSRKKSKRKTRRKTRKYKKKLIYKQNK